MSVLSLAAGQTDAPQQTVLPIGSAMIRDLKGEVICNSPQGTPMSAQPGSILTTEDRIETAKGSVLLELEDGSQVLIRAHSSVVLKSPNEGQGYFLELLLGKILVKVQKRLGSNPSFRMGTPSAVITVRGTRFSVEVNKKGKTYVEVFEGLVDVAGIVEGSPHLLIRPGFSTGVELDRAPEEPRETNPGEGSGREDGNAQQGVGGDRSREDQPRSQPQKGQPKQGPEGKPD
jgi:ferric-dicitrate binding protein FerR (iron transport regulator)